MDELDDDQIDAMVERNQPKVTMKYAEAPVDEPVGQLLHKPEDIGETNKALELTDAMAPFLTPMPSDDSEFIRTVAEFALELTPRQNAILTKLGMLIYDLDEEANFLESKGEECTPEDKRHIKNMRLQAKKLRYKVSEFFKNKRYHDAKFFISDAIQSMSWRKFVVQGAVSGNVNKSTMM